MNRPLPVVLFALMLTGCGEIETPDCGMPASAPTADTVFAFQVDGRQVLQGSGEYYPRLNEFTEHGFAEMTALVQSGERHEWLAIRLTPFVGTGSYPIAEHYQDHPFAWVTYYCSEVPGWYWTGRSEWADTVHVTAFDTLTRHIEVSFSGRMRGNYPGQYVDVTAGNIQGTLIGQ